MLITPVGRGHKAPVANGVNLPRAYVGGRKASNILDGSLFVGLET